MLSGDHKTKPCDDIHTQNYQTTVTTMHALTAGHYALPLQITLGITAIFATERPGTIARCICHYAVSLPCVHDYYPVYKLRTMTMTVLFVTVSTSDDKREIYTEPKRIFCNV